MSAATFGINYLINITTSNLQAVDELYRELKRVQELAKQGADFSVRIEKGALDGIKDTVAKAVAEGVAAGGGGARVPRASSTSSGHDDAQRRTKLDQLIRTMQSLTQAVDKLANRPGAPSGGGRSYVGGPIDAATASRTADIGINSELRKAQHEMNLQRREVQRLEAKLARFERVTSGSDRLNPEGIDDLVDRARAGSVLYPRQQRAKYRRYISDIQTRIAVNPDEGLEQLGHELFRLRKEAGDRIVRLREQLERERQQLRQLRERQGGRYDERQTAREIRVDGSGGYGNASFVRDGGGRADGFGTLRISLDKAGLEAAFESAAIKFADRTIAIWQEHGVGGAFGGGMRPATGPGSYGKRSYASEDGPKVCGRCGGSGVFASKHLSQICGRCGGSGIENMPNREVLKNLGLKGQFHSLGASGSVPAQHIGGVTPEAASRLGMSGTPGPVVFKASPMDQFDPYDPTRTPQGMTFYPHSVDRRRRLKKDLERHLQILSTGYVYPLDADGNVMLDKTGKPLPGMQLDVQKRPLYQQHTLELANEFERRGVFLPEGNTHKFLYNGIYISPNEYRRMRKGGAINPRAASPTDEQGSPDVLEQVTRHANAMLGSFGALQRVDLSKLENSFESLRTVMAGVNNTLNQMGPLLNTATAEEIRVRALEREVKLRQELKQKRMEDANARKQEREKDRLQRDAALQQMLKDRDTAIQGGAFGFSDDPSHRQRLYKLLGRSLRGYGNEIQGSYEATGLASILEMGGQPGEARIARRRAQSAIQRAELHAGYAINRAERLLALDPKTFAALRDPIGAFRAAQAKYSTGQDLFERIRKVREEEFLVQTDRMYGKDGAIVARETPLSLKEKRARLNALGMQRSQYVQEFANLYGLQATTVKEKDWLIKRFNKDTGTYDKSNTFSRSVLELSGAQMEPVLKREQVALLEQQHTLTGIVGKRYEQLQLATKEGTLLDQFTQKFKSLAMYVAAGGVLYTALNSLRTGLSEAIRFEQDMAEIQGIFVTKTGTERDLVKSGVMDLAYRYGVGRSDVAAQAKAFAQTGANPTNTIALTNAALLATRGAGVNPDQAAEMLIAVQNLSGGKVTPADIIDRISRIEARYPVTAQDLSTAIQRVGSVATQLQPTMGGVDAFDTINGMVTSIISKTRVTGNQAATGLRFMLARLNSPNVQRALQQQFGIQLAGNNPEQLRPLTDILGDIAGKYKGYLANGQSGQAAALLTTFAGARQANTAAALFDNWKGTMDIARESSLAFGDSQKRLAIQMDTLATRVQQTENAFLNFFTTLLEKTPLMGILKFGVSAAGKGANALASNPTAGMLVGSGLSFGGSYLLSMGARALGGGALGMGAGAAAWGLAGAGLLGAGLTAYQLTDYVVNGDIRRAKQKQELYGPTAFDRDTYAQSEQGKAYETEAKKYGLTSETFYQRIGDAVARAQADVLADPRFKGQNVFAAYGDRYTNPALSETFRSSLVAQLGTSLPGFDTKDHDAAVANALEYLRGSLQYGNVAYSVQNAGFIEQANRERQTLQAALNTPGGTASPTALDAMRRARHAYEKYGQSSLTMRDDYHEGAYTWRSSVYNVHPSSIGFGYNQQLAQLMGHTGAGAQMKDVISILNAFDSQLSIGTALAGTRFAGGGSLLTKALELIDKKSKTLGEALDLLSDTLLSTKDGMEETKRAIKTSLQNAFDFTGRRDTAAAATRTTASAPDYAGGRFAQKYIELYDQALSELVSSGALDSNDPRVKQILGALQEDFDPNNRQRRMLDIASSMGGGSLRAVLRNRVTDPIFQYAQRVGSLQAQGRLFGAAGLHFDTLGAHAEAARSFLQGIAEVQGALPVDSMRAQQEYQLARMQAAKYPGISEEYFAGGEETEGDRAALNVMKPGVRAELEKARRGYKGISPDQIRELKLKAEVFRQILKDFASSSENILGALSPDQQQSIATLLSINDPIEFFFRALSQKGQLEKLGLSQKGVLERELGRKLGAISGAGDDNRRLAMLAHQGDIAQAHFAGLARLAEISSNPLGVLSATYSGIQARQGSAYSIAAAQRQAVFNALRRDGVDSTSDEYKLRVGQAEDAFKSAILAADQEAQKSVISLMTDARIKYAEMQEQHLENLVQQSAQGFKQLFTSPEKLSFRFQDTLVPPIAQAISGGLSDALVNNLVGPDGLFGDAAKQLFNQPMLQEAQIIKMAHIQGITEGMARVYGFAGGGLTMGGTTGVSGLSIGAGSSLAAFGGIGGTLAAASLLGGGGGSSAAGSPLSSDFLQSIQGTVAEDLISLGNLDKAKLNKAVRAQAAAMGGVMLGGLLGYSNGVRDHQGRPNNYASEGASLGAFIGGLTPLGPIGAVLGGMLGGLFGGRMGKFRAAPTPESQALQLIEQHTRETVDAIQNQTHMLALDNRFLNVPSGFQVPFYNPFPSDQGSVGSLIMGGPSGTRSVVVNAPVTVNIPAGTTAADAQAIGDAVAAAVAAQLRGSGSYSTSRY